MGDFEQATQNYDKALSLESQPQLDFDLNILEVRNFIYSNRANAHFKSGQFQQAMKDYNEAIKLNPKDTTAYSNRGGAYGMVAQFQRAIRDCDEAIRIDPHNVQAYINRGGAYGELLSLE